MTPTPTIPSQRRWSPRSIALIVLAWAILQLGGLFSPGLLDDVDSIYLQVAREMLQRHDYVTPTIDGIRFFDKPPLMYWMAAASMKVFGVHDWAARLPLALGVLALLLAVYALGRRLYPTNLGAPGPDFRTRVGSVVPTDRAGLYAALALATSLGTYLYTRFYIPDILIALWMTLSVHLFLIALDRANSTLHSNSVILSEASQLLREAQSKDPDTLHTTSTAWTFLTGNSPLLPMLGLAAVMALSLLTKGLIGIVFPLAFVILYLALTRQLRLLSKLRLIPSTLVFLLIAAPWHILAWLRNPAIAMPAGLGLPARAGWAWFYLYNEHVARFLGHRIPHDYGNVPVPIFWLLLLLWMLPWVAFLPAAVINAVRTLRTGNLSSKPWALNPGPSLTLLLWPAIILGFFTFSSRQEYYHLPALPALALLIGGLLAAADSKTTTLGAPGPGSPASALARSGGDPDSRTREFRLQSLRSSLYFLFPLGSLLFLLCGYLALTAPTPHPGTTLTDVLNSNPANYNLSLGHLFDLTGQAMGFFRGPLLAVALGMLVLGPVAYFIRRSARGKNHTRTFTANLTIAAGMIVVLLAAHEGLARFYPILGSKDLALAIVRQLQPGDWIVIDGELTSGSTLLFYTPQRAQPVLLVNGRVNGPWFGSFWPDAPNIFPDDAQLDSLWAGPQRVFLLTYHPESRIPELRRLAPVHEVARSGGKTVITNR